MKKELKVGVAGFRGSFSEEATNYFLSKKQIENYELVYLVSVENVLSAIEKSEVDLGIFPIENSNGGIVYESVHAMSAHFFSIKEIFEIDIKMNLMVKNGVNPGEIEKIVSHPQALKQCRMYLKRKWAEVDLEEYVDTAKSAKDLAEGNLPGKVAVIVPKICAEMYGLDIIEESIQDLKFNFTTFIAGEKK